MCPAIQQMIAAGYAEGFAEGFARGRMEAYVEVVEAGMIDVHYVASQLGMTAEEFLQKTGITIPKN
ncbi:MAG: hypothetical protein IJ719_07625 [Clostridia bacterium]|nr:hypothetical protein [Clostridia bacterium]